MESSAMETKSSNEILTELFGAFNVEPPNTKDKTKRRTSSETENFKHKKSKKSKSKKSKKKIKNKSKKHKRKRSGYESGSESGMVKKKRRNKEKKRKKRNLSPNSVNIELPVNKVPMALEIMLDGTVGIKGENGVITKIPDVCESEINLSETETQEQNIENNSLKETLDEECSINIEKIKSEQKKTEENVLDSMLTTLFESKTAEASEKQKKGKIQIKDLKFSSVFQETVKAVEEKKKKEEEKKADYEEGELSNTSEDESKLKNESVKEEKLKHRESSRHKHRSHSKSHRKRENKKYSKSRSRSRSRSRGRFVSSHHSHDHSSKRFRSRSRDYSLHHSKEIYGRQSSSSSHNHYSRSRTSHKSRSRTRSRSRSRSKSKSRSVGRVKSRLGHRSNSKETKRHCPSKSNERSESLEKIDKEKLLAIARKNALKLIDAGVLPGAEKLTTIKAGGKTVNELTEYCKKISEKEALGDDVSDIESESSEDEEKPFHHPFQVRDRPSSIIMNIKNSIPLPVKSLQEKAAEQAKQLRLQFPVSSGSSHRRTESEWVPVSPKKEEPPIKQPDHVPAILPVAPPPLPIENLSIPPPPLPPQHLNPIPHIFPHPQTFPPNHPPPPITMPLFMTAVPPPEPPNKPVFPVIQPNFPMSKLGIGSIVSKRLEAIRKLQENPNDSQALTQMQCAQQEMQYWAESKQETGAFTGTTGAKVLSPSELNSGVQAWAKRDQLTNATPVRGGMGMALLQKMGWQPGEGLGKNKEGTLEPLRLEVKMDKKGLLAPDESRKGKKGPNILQGPPLPTVKTLDGKHPVSLLNELCCRRRYGVPQFELCFECGPDHKKNFLFKVKVNGIEYTPSVASPNKKQAKAEAAAICLRALGVISSNNAQQN